METRTLEWYVDSFKHEIKRFAHPEFIGSVTFCVNMREGTIGNMNIEMKKSVKMPREVDN